MGVLTVNPRFGMVLMGTHLKNMARVGNFDARREERYAKLSAVAPVKYLICGKTTKILIQLVFLHRIAPLIRKFPAESFSCVSQMSVAMVMKIEREEDFNLATATIEELFDAQPGSEEAELLKALVLSVRAYIAWTPPPPGSELPACSAKTGIKLS